MSLQDTVPAERAFDFNSVPTLPNDCRYRVVRLRTGTGFGKSDVWYVIVEQETDVWNSYMERYEKQYVEAARSWLSGAFNYNEQDVPAAARKAYLQAGFNGTGK